MQRSVSRNYKESSGVPAEHFSKPAGFFTGNFCMVEPSPADSPYVAPPTLVSADLAPAARHEQVSFAATCRVE